MKHQILQSCAAIAFCLVTFPSFGGSYPAPEPAEGACPYDHGDLWKVPVVYGLLHPSDEQRRLIDAGEILPAGDRPRSGGVEWGLRCGSCGFRTIGVAAAGEWYRHSEDAASFEIPLGEAIRTLPLVEPTEWVDAGGAERRVVYSQTVFFQTVLSQTLDRRGTVHESVTYQTDAAAAELIASLERFVTGAGGEAASWEAEEPSVTQRLSYRRTIEGFEEHLWILHPEVSPTRSPLHRVELVRRRVWEGSGAEGPTER